MEEISVDWNTSNAIQQRITYIASLSHNVLMPKVFLDEIGFNMHLKKGKGRALAGEKASNINSNAKRSTHLFDCST